MMRARGMTLLEVLIALAVILALAALALPTMLQSLDERGFVAATDVIRGQILMARAHAQRSGRAVELIYLPDERTIVAREINSDHASGEPAASESAGRETRRGDAFRDDGDLVVSSSDSPALPERWATQVLNDPLELRFREPTRVLDGTASAFRFPEDEDSTSVGPARFVALAPDGTVMQARPAWLTDGVSRVAKLNVNPWTGASEVVRLHQSRSQQSAQQADSDKPLESAMPLALEDDP